MKKLFLILFLAIGYLSNAQVPTGLPTLFNGKWYKYTQYLQADSGFFNPQRDTMFIPNRAGCVVFRTADSILYIYTGSRWKGVGSGGGTGIYNAGYGLNLTSGTFRVDSSLISTKLWRQKGVDSLNAVKLNKSDTASMLLPYLRKADTIAMLFPYLRKGDTAVMLTPYLRKADTINFNLQYVTNKGNKTTNKISLGGNMPPYHQLEIYYPKTNIIGNLGLGITDTSNQAIGAGGSLSFYSRFITGDTAKTIAGYIDAYKEKSTSNNWDFSLRFLTREDTTTTAKEALVLTALRNAKFKGSVSLDVPGSKLSIATGVNASIGVFTLVNGVATVNTSAVTSNSKIFFTRKSIGTSTALGELTYTIVDGVSFTITSLRYSSLSSTETNDSSIIDWFLIN